MLNTLETLEIASARTSSRMSSCSPINISQYRPLELRQAAKDEAGDKLLVQRFVHTEHLKSHLLRLRASTPPSRQVCQQAHPCTMSSLLHRLHPSR